MMHKFIRRVKSDGFNSFIHFLATFTGIFLIMTVMILQILNYGVYSNVDASLKTTSSKPEEQLKIAMFKQDFLGSSAAQGTTATIIQGYDKTSGSSTEATQNTNQEASKKKDAKKDAPPQDMAFAANMGILVLDKNGSILNPVDELSSLADLPFNINTTDVISQGSAENYFHQTEKYRFVTKKVSSELYPEAAYVVIAINTTQLEEANERYVRWIVIMMIIFWLLSIAASMYLAKWSRRPIQESLEKQKAFVENASHELRTPLAVIQNRLEALFRKPESTILDNSENIASSLDEVRNMRLLTTNLLNLARRDDGITPEIETLDANFFETIFENYSMIAEENGKDFEAFNQVGRPIQTDKTLLKQLMTILFDNAIKYTEEDGQVSFTVRTNDRHLYLTIADNGPGISDVDKKKIFDRFYRVDKARTRQKGGFGLGLSLAQQIVMALKGSIVVKDNQPKGTIFEVKISNV